MFVIGTFVGAAINALVGWLPSYIFRQWESDAQVILGLSNNQSVQSRCRNSSSIERRTFVVIACGVLCVAVIHLFEFTREGLAFMVLTWSLIMVSLIDADHKILPDIIVLPLIWAGLIMNNLGFYTTNSAALWGAVGGYMSMWIIARLFQLVAGQEGIGQGDFKLVSAIGAWGGWQVLPYTVLLAALLGVLVYSFSRFFGVRFRTESTIISFGPYISAAGWVVMLYSRNSVLFPL